MNILVDDIETIVKEKIKIDFNSDFRICILFELLMQDNEISQEAKIIQAINLFYPNKEQITDIKEAIDNITWFYRCGKEIKTSRNKRRKRKANL